MPSDNYAWQKLKTQNKPSHFAGGVLTPPLTKISQKVCSPPLDTPFNGSTLQAAWSTSNENGERPFGRSPCVLKKQINLVLIN